MSAIDNVAPSFVQNFSRSVLYNIDDALRFNVMPNTFSIIDSNRDVLQNTFDITKNFKNHIKQFKNKFSSSSFKSDISEAFSNTKKDLKSGSWFNKNRQDASESKMFGMDFDMDFENIGNAIQGTNNEIKESTDKLNNSVSLIEKATLDVASVNYKGTALGFDKVNSNLCSLVSFNNEVKKPFFKTTTNYFNDSINTQKELLTIIKNKFTTKEQNQSSTDSSVDKILGSGFNIKEFFNNTKKNIKNDISNSPIGMMQSMSSFGNPMEMFKASPISFLLGMTNTNSLGIPKGLTSGLKTFDKMITGFTASLILKINKTITDNQRNSDESLKGFFKNKVLNMFKVNMPNKTKISTDKYIKKEMSYNGLADKSITEVIPMYLRKILSSITKKEEIIYDYNEGKAVKKSSKEKEITDEINNAGFINMFDFKEKMTKNANITDINAQTKFQEDLNKFFNATEGSLLPIQNNNFDTFKNFLNGKNVKFDTEDGEKKIFDSIMKLSEAERLLFSNETIALKNEKQKKLKEIENNQHLSGYSQVLMDKGLSGSNRIRQSIPLKDSLAQKKFTILNDIRRILYKGVIAVHTVGRDAFRGSRKKGYSKFKSNKQPKTQQQTPQATTNTSQRNFMNEFLQSQQQEQQANQQPQQNKWNDFFNRPIKFFEGKVNKLSHKLYTIIFGNDNQQEGENTSFFSCVEERFNSTFDSVNAKLSEIFESLKTKFSNIFDDLKSKFNPYLEKAKTFLFGGEGSVFKGKGLFGSTKNFFSDTLKSTMHSIIGKAYEDSQGNKFAENSKSFLNIGKDMFKNLYTKTSNFLLGEKNNGKRNFKDGFLNSMLSSIITPFNNFKNEFFGGNKKPKGESKFKNVLKEINDGSEGIKGVGKFSLAGGVAGLFLPGGPIVGSLLATTLGLTKKSKTFNEMLFGKLKKGINGKKIQIEGLIPSKYANKIKDFLPDMKKTMITGGIAGLFLPGGPITGSLLASAIKIKGLDTKFKELVFGKKDENGNKISNGILDKVPNSFKKNFKKYGTSALTGGIAGLFLPGGPLVGSILLSSANFLSTSEKFKDMLLGKEGKNGKRQGGLKGLVDLFVGRPVKLFFDKTTAGMKSWMVKNIKNPFLDSIAPFKKEAQLMFGAFKDKAKGLLKTIDNSFAKHIGQPLTVAIKTKLIDPISKTFKTIFSTFFKTLGGIISAPFKLLKKSSQGLVKKHIKNGNADYLNNGYLEDVFNRKKKQEDIDKLNEKKFGRRERKLKDKQQKFIRTEWKNHLNNYAERQKKRKNKTHWYDDAGQNTKIKKPLLKRVKDNVKTNYLFSSFNNGDENVIEKLKNLNYENLKYRTPVKNATNNIKNLKNNLKIDNDIKEKISDGIKKGSDIISNTSDKIKEKKESFSKKLHNSFKQQTENSTKSQEPKNKNKEEKKTENKFAFVNPNIKSPKVSTPNISSNFSNFKPIDSDILIKHISSIDKNSIITADSVKGQLNGLGWNTDKVVDILQKYTHIKGEAFGEGKRKSNKKRVGIVGKLKDMVLQPFTIIKSTINEGISKAKSNVSKAFKTVTKIFVSPFKKVGGLISGIGKGLKKTASTLLTITNDAIKGFSSLLKGFLQGLGPMLAGAGKIVGETFKGVAVGLGEAARGITKGIADISSGLFSAMGGVAKGFGNLAKESIPALGKAVGSATKFIFSTISSVLKTGFNAVKGIGNFLVNPLKKIGGKGLTKKVYVVGGKLDFISKIDNFEPLKKIPSLLEVIISKMGFGGNKKKVTAGSYEGQLLHLKEEKELKEKSENQGLMKTIAKNISDTKDSLLGIGKKGFFGKLIAIGIGIKTFLKGIPEKISKALDFLKNPLSHLKDIFSKKDIAKKGLQALNSSKSAYKSVYINATKCFVGDEDISSKSNAIKNATEDLTTAFNKDGKHHKEKARFDGKLSTDKSTISKQKGKGTKRLAGKISKFGGKTLSAVSTGMDLFDDPVRTAIEYTAEHTPTIKDKGKLVAGFAGRTLASSKKAVSKIVPKKVTSSITKATSVVADSGKGIINKLAKQITKLLSNKKIVETVGAKNINKIISNVIPKVLEKGVVQAGTKSALYAVTGGTIAFAVFAASFVAGFNNARKFFQVPKGQSPTFSMKIASALGQAISDTLFNIIPCEWIAELIFNTIGSDEAKNKKKQMEIEMKQQADEQGLDVNAYNDSINKSLGSRMWDGVKSGASKAWSGTKKIVTKAWDGTKDLASKAWNGVKSGASKAWNGVKSVGTSAKNMGSKALHFFGFGRGDSNNTGSVKGPKTSNGMAYYSQKDPNWSDISYKAHNDSLDDTIGSAGCGPTAVSMALSKYGIDVDPTITSKYAMEHGYKESGSGTSANFFQDITANAGVPFKGNVLHDTSDVNYIDRQLINGNPVITLGQDKANKTPYTSAGHYLVIAGKDEKGNYKVNDPLNPNNNNKSYKQEDLFNKTEAYWTPGKGPNISDIITGLGGPGEKAINTAKSFVGSPYVWGGTGQEITDNYISQKAREFPDHKSLYLKYLPQEKGKKGFDCSGLMMYSYKQAGINLPRTAREQQSSLPAVSKDKLAPSDLVFFGKPAHHVGMYLGGGKYIHSPKSGDHVKISDLSGRKDFSGGARVIKDGLPTGDFSSGGSSTPSATANTNGDTQKQQSSDAFSVFSDLSSEMTKFVSSSVLGDKNYLVDQPAPSNDSSSSSGGTLPPSDASLGWLSAKYETGGYDPGCYTNSPGDPGGASYGLAQFNKDSLRGFIESTKATHPKIYARLKKYPQASGAFTKEWKSIASDSKQEFINAQRDYTASVFYLPSVRSLKGYIDVESKPRAVKEAVWSTSVQHGCGKSTANLVKKGVSSFAGGPTAPDDRIISAIYDERGKDDGRAHFPRASRQIQHSVAQRFQKEKADALAMLKSGRGEGKTTSGQRFINAIKKPFNLIKKVASVNVKHNNDTQYSIPNKQLITSNETLMNEKNVQILQSILGVLNCISDSNNNILKNTEIISQKDFKPEFKIQNTENNNNNKEKKELKKTEVNTSQPDSNNFFLGKYDTDKTLNSVGEKALRFACGN